MILNIKGYVYSEFLSPGPLLSRPADTDHNFGLLVIVLRRP